MKKLKELKIFKKQLDLIKNSNEDLEIYNLIISDTTGYYDNFYLENIEFFINKKISNICLNIIRFFDKQKIESHLEGLIKTIANSNNYNAMIDLINYNLVEVKNKDKKPLKDFKEQELKVYRKIVRSDDPIIYLRSAIYCYGSWKNSYLSFESKNKIHDVILSYDFKKFNLNFEVGDDSNLHKIWKEPYNYLEWLLKYCISYFNGDRWLEAEQKVFKFAPYYMDRYIREVIKTKDSIIEDILLEMDEPSLYFNYARDILKKGWEDFRDDKNLKDSNSIIKDKIIDAALDSISSSPRHIAKYSIEVIKKRLTPKMEEKMFIELNKKIKDYYLNYHEFSKNVSNVYFYTNKIKEKFPLFEQFLLKINNLRGGLKLNDFYQGYQEGDFDEFNEEAEFKKLLDEIIYGYTIINRNKEWIEIGINDRNDLIKLRKRIVENKVYISKFEGYGELDY